jgi:hypothetical protein
MKKIPHFVMLHDHEVQHGVVHGFDVLVERGGRIVGGSLPVM